MRKAPLGPGAGRSRFARFASFFGGGGAITSCVPLPESEAPDAEASTSSRVILPPSPVPRTFLRSMPFSRASLRTAGEVGASTSALELPESLAAGAACAAPPSLAGPALASAFASISQSASPTATRSPSVTKIFVTTPAEVAGISLSALSVMISTRGSSLDTR